MNVLEKVLEEIESLKTNLAKNNGTPQCYWHDVGLDKAKAVVKKHMGEAKNDGWIPVEERLPEDDDMRFYMCIVENHEEDLPMFCQYDSEYGFGFWHDMYDPVSLGFLDTEFRTNDELGYEKVIAWQPLPEPYKPHEHDNHTSAMEERERFFTEGEPIYERT